MGGSLDEIDMSSLRGRYSVSQVGCTARKTIKAPISAVGHGLHSGAEVHLQLCPAPVNTGIIFRRTDLGGADIPARFHNVTDTRLCTLVSHGAARVGTIEHLMAALAATGIDDLIIELNAAEVPVFDGSAAPFLFLIESAGIIEHGGARPVLEILRPVRVEQDEAFAELQPHAAQGKGLDMDMSIAFKARAIGTQTLQFHLSESMFMAQIAQARTFTMLAEIEALRQAGLARGGSLANAVVVDDDKILNPEGLRFEDEFVRHKMLDAIGDLYLAGAPINGVFKAHRTGHSLNNQLLRAVFADQANYRLATGQLAAPLQLTAA